MTEADFDFIFSDDAKNIGRCLYTADLRDSRLLTQLQDLRMRFTASQARQLIQLARLRQKASGRFPNVAELYFTAEALQQSTHWEIAQLHARWIHTHADPGPVLDLGCGIGGDLLAIGQHREVVAYESDPIRARFAQANVHTFGLADRVTIKEHDWLLDLAAGSLPAAGAAFVDPVRRLDDRRIFDVERIGPPLSSVLQLLEKLPCLCIKLMPGIQDKDLPSGSVVTFISHEGICKEAMLWISSDSDDTCPPKRRAAVHTDNGWLEVDVSGDSPPVGPLKEGLILHEPDPAVIRAGAFAELCAELNGWLFDPNIAYLVTSDTGKHLLTRSFRILEVHIFGLKLLNQRLLDLNIGRVELKKRGMPFEPESLRRRLKTAPGGIPGVVFFTRRGDQRLMIIAQRI